MDTIKHLVLSMSLIVIILTPVVWLMDHYLFFEQGHIVTLNDEAWECADDGTVSKVGVCPSKLVTPLTNDSRSWRRLVHAVAAVESGNDPEAYNERENAVGLLQVRQEVIDDLNEWGDGSGLG